jgi:hypothetical protein
VRLEDEKKLQKRRQLTGEKGFKTEKKKIVNVRKKFELKRDVIL